VKGPLHCPRDGTASVLERDRGPKASFVIDVCPRCHGAWFDRGEISKAAGDREIERMIVAYAGGASELTCPRCGLPMARRPVGDVSLDVCLQCKGVWFDPDELETAERTLAGEFSAFEPNLEPGAFARSRLIVSKFFTPRASLDLILKPPIKRTFPPEDL
jgi:Zn-finger nucleic acid-binding protein